MIHPGWAIPIVCLAYSLWPRRRRFSYERRTPEPRLVVVRRPLVDWAEKGWA